MNDEEKLKAALVKMLPDNLCLSNCGWGNLIWKTGPHAHKEVYDTEMLFIVWMIEMQHHLRFYYDSLCRVMGLPAGTDHATTMRATWQQRTRALADAKGIEL